MHRRGIRDRADCFQRRKRLEGQGLDGPLAPANPVGRSDSYRVRLLDRFSSFCPYFETSAGSLQMSGVWISMQVARKRSLNRYTSCKDDNLSTLSLLLYNARKQSRSCFSLPFGGLFGYLSMKLPCCTFSAVQPLNCAFRNVVTTTVREL